MSLISSSVRRLKRDYQTFRSDREKELAENVTSVREELFPQQIKPNADYSVYYWANITASCSGGPFITTGIKRIVDSTPTPRFIEQFREIIESNSVFANLGIEDCLKKIYRFEVQCPCLQFLCSGIARHSSWVAACSTGMDIMTSNHRSLYHQFIKVAVQNIRMIQDQGDANGLADLIALEKGLTHVAFEAWPILFEGAYQFNYGLLDRISNGISEWETMFPNMPPLTSPESAIEELKEEYEFINEFILDPILAYWIYLDAQISTVGLYGQGLIMLDDLQFDMATKWLEMCIAANRLVIDIVVEIDQLYSSRDFGSRLEFLDFWLDEVLHRIKHEWIEVGSFLENIENVWNTRMSFPQWVEIENLEDKKREILRNAWRRLDNRREFELFMKPFPERPQGHFRLLEDASDGD